MEFKEGKALFVERWGLLGTEWGINRTMAQIHAILLISPKPLCTEDLMQELQISRGNTSMNLKALLDWEIRCSTASSMTGETTNCAMTCSTSIAKTIVPISH